MCEAIRAISPDIPIVITTAFEEPHYFQRAIDLGVDKYVVKPINPAILEEALLKCGRSIRAEAALREVQDRYQVLFTLSQIPMSITGAGGGVAMKTDNLVSARVDNDRILECNLAFLDLIGYQSTEMLQFLTLSDLIKPEFLARLKKLVLDELLVRGFTREVELELQRIDGQFVQVMAQFILRRNEIGQPLEMWALMRNITEQRKAEKQLILAKQVFDNALDAILITDTDNNIVSANNAFYRITGYSSSEVMGRNPRLLQSGRHGPDFYQEVWQSLLEQGRWQGEVWNRRKNGEIYTEWLSISTVKDGGGRIVNYIGIFSDITEAKADSDYIAFLAHYDPLTQLPNRVLLRDRLEQAISMARRENKHVAVMFLDLDRFKLINDSMGHGVGDNLLIQVGERMVQALREADTVARVGGDEFVLVQPAISEAEDSAVIARKILDSLRSPFNCDGYELTVTTSIGIALFPEDGNDFDTLLKNADTAMYSAKQNGRDNYEFFTVGMNTETMERMSLESQLRRALEQGQFELFYQPEIDSENGRLTGMEALLRWRHPDLGLVLPGKFISLAEDTGLIVPIGAWVLREACRQNALWQRQGLAPVVMAVNLSALQFRRRDLRETIADALKDYGLDASWLELELTESIVMSEAETTIATLQALKSAGIKLSIDDFGTGYSSLAYLKRFAVDKLKIDRSFICNIPSDAEDAAIVRAIISLAHELGLCVIAEGVETMEQLRFLRDQQCDLVQGYLFSKPVSAAEMGVLLQNRSITIA
ncbi:EAL domain-containing protein [Methylicorpusculum oleiharenae]|nr:EAL domain-containing protein [Methylicorpusculum oleiharenae]